MGFSANTELPKVFSEEPNSVNKERKGACPESIGEAMEVINMLFAIAIATKTTIRTCVARPGSRRITYTVFN